MAHVAHLHGLRRRQLKDQRQLGLRARQVLPSQVAVRMVKVQNKDEKNFLNPISTELSGSSSPLNHSSMSDKHKPTVEIALNSLTSEMVRVCYTDVQSIRIYKSQDL